MAVSKVEEFNWGMYVLKTDGKIIVDEEGAVFSIASAKHDFRKINKLLAGGREMGYDKLTYEFWDGALPLTDEEAEQQEQDIAETGVSRFDAGNFMDDVRNERARKNN